MIYTSTFQGVKEYQVNPQRDGELPSFRNYLAPFGRSRYMMTISKAFRGLRTKTSSMKGQLTQACELSARAVTLSLCHVNPQKIRKSLWSHTNTKISLMFGTCQQKKHKNILRKKGVVSKKSHIFCMGESVEQINKIVPDGNILNLLRSL